MPPKITQMPPREAQIPHNKYLIFKAHFAKKYGWRGTLTSSDTLVSSPHTQHTLLEYGASLIANNQRGLEGGNKLSQEK